MANNHVNQIKTKLDKYLDEIRAQFGDDKQQITWSHAKYRYELEIPSVLLEGNQKPENFEFTS